MGGWRRRICVLAAVYPLWATAARGRAVVAAGTLPATRNRKDAVVAFMFVGFANAIFGTCVVCRVHDVLPRHPLLVPGRLPGRLLVPERLKMPEAEHRKGDGSGNLVHGVGCVVGNGVPLKQKFVDGLHNVSVPRGRR